MPRWCARAAVQRHRLRAVPVAVGVDEVRHRHRQRALLRALVSGHRHVPVRLGARHRCRFRVSSAVAVGVPVPRRAVTRIRVRLVRVAVAVVVGARVRAQLRRARIRVRAVRIRVVVAVAGARDMGPCGRIACRVSLPRTISVTIGVRMPRRPSCRRRIGIVRKPIAVLVDVERIAALLPLRVHPCTRVIAVRVLRYVSGGLDAAHDEDRRIAEVVEVLVAEPRDRRLRERIEGTSVPARGHVARRCDA